MPEIALGGSQHLRAYYQAGRPLRGWRDNRHLLRDKPGFVFWVSEYLMAAWLMIWTVLRPMLLWLWALVAAPTTHNARSSRYRAHEQLFARHRVHRVW